MEAKEYFNVDHSLYDLYDPEFLAYPLRDPRDVPQELYARMYQLSMATEPSYARMFFLLMQKQVDERNAIIKSKNQKIIDLSKELSTLKRANKK